MSDDLPDDLDDGDALEPWHFNCIYEELRRLRKLSAAAPLAVDSADGDDPPCVYLTDEPAFFIQLTGTYSSGYSWKEVVVAAGRVVSDAGVVGTGAYERQTGDTTLTVDGTVYEARYSPGGGLTFDGKN